MTKEGKDKVDSRRGFLQKSTAAAIAAAITLAGCESEEERRRRAVEALPKLRTEALNAARVLVADIQKIRANAKIYDSLPAVLLGGESDQEEATIKQRWDQLSEQEKEMMRAVATHAEDLADALDLLFATATTAGATREQAEAEIKKIFTQSGITDIPDLTQADIEAISKQQAPRHYAGGGGFWFWYYWFYVMNGNRYNARAWSGRDRLGRVKPAGVNGGRASEFGGRGSARGFGRGGGFGGRGGGFG